MANFIQKLLGGGNNSGLATSGGGGGKIMVPSSSDLSKINPSELLKSLDPDVDPTAIRQLPTINVPKIPGVKLVTDKELADTKKASQIFQKGIDNFKEYAAEGGKMEVKAAEGTQAYQKYIAARRKAQSMIAEANKLNGIDAANYGLGIQEKALELDRHVKEVTYQIENLSVAYAEIGGWS